MLHFSISSWGISPLPLSTIILTYIRTYVNGNIKFIEKIKQKKRGLNTLSLPFRYDASFIKLKKKIVGFYGDYLTVFISYKMKSCICHHVIYITTYIRSLRLDYAHDHPTTIFLIVFFLTRPVFGIPCFF